MKRCLIFVSVLVAVAATVVQPVAAADLAKFRAENIIDDSVFQNVNTMSPTAVQQFLNDRNSVCLRAYQTPSILGNNNYGGNVSAAQAVVQAAQLWNINPQVLLVTMQKENSLITRTSCPDYVYRTSLGVGCPDTAPCDAQYFGLSRQLYQAARWLRNYFDQTPGWYTLRPGVNYIQYNPNAGCGGRNINILNRATAALYTFTPYQPNAAALAAGYGLGDGCSAYGNRNFWLYFTDWFGSTYAGDAIYAIADNGDPRQWILSAGKRYHVPSTDIIDAWGLGERTLVRLSATYLGGFADGPTLSRYVRDTSNGAEYLVDGATRYHFVTGAQEAAWRADPRIALDGGLLRTFLRDGGDLGYSVKFKGAGEIYMIDDGTLRQYDSIPVLQSLEHVAIAEIDVSQKARFAVGSVLYGNKVQAGAVTYLMDGGKKMPLPGAYASLYPGSAATVSASTLDRLSTIRATQFVKSPASDKIYLMDAGKKRHVLSLDILKSYSRDKALPGDLVAVLSQAAVDTLFPEGATLASMYASSGTETYLIDGSALQVAPALRAAYLAGGDPSTNLLSNDLLEILGKQLAKDFMSDSQGRYYVVDGGVRRWISSLPVYISTANPADRSLTKLADSVIASIPSGPAFDTPFVTDTDGTTWYLSAMKRYRLDAAHKTSWGVSRTTPVSTSFLANYADSGVATDIVRFEGATYVARGGKLYKDPRGNAVVWTEDPTIDIDAAIGFYLEKSAEPLTVFAKSTNAADSRIFVKDLQGLYHIMSIPQLQNFAGSQPFNTIPMSPQEIQALNPVGASMTSIMDSHGTTFLVVAGKKRPLSDATVTAAWKTDDTAQVSDALLGLLATGDVVSQTVLKASDQNEIYAVENGVKRWIYYQPYVSRYIGKPIFVTDRKFVAAYPTGGPITN